MERLRNSNNQREEWQVKCGKPRVQAKLFAYRIPEQIAAERRRKLKIARRKKGQAVTQRNLELCGWTLYITNEKQMSQDEAAVLYGSRWQIELIFKLWKQHMKIDESVSKNPERMLCEMYIKLMAALVQHWIVISSPCWL